MRSDSAKAGELYNRPMPPPILATKLYIPPPRPRVVLRSRLIERMNESLQRAAGITLISAPAGFGKTTLVSEWIAALTPGPSPAGRGETVRVAWLSLDEGDNDPARFLMYFVAALQMIAPQIGGTQFSQLAADAQTGQRERWILSGGDDQVQLRRQVIDQKS